MNCSKTELLEKLAEIVGDDWLKTDAADLENFGKDWTSGYSANPVAIVFPGDIDSVVAIVQLANLHAVALVPSGGRTGLSGGAVAANKELVVAFDRMNKILSFDATDRQVVCEAGVVTEQLQQFAEQESLFYPVDFASSGSSQLGGNASTNAGGIKVIRYGMTREWIKGLKVVTGNAEVLDLNRGLAKNATGYDFRHLFIGAEGTLGFIVELTVALTNQPKHPTVLVLAVEKMESIMQVLSVFQGKLKLTAFEFFSEKALQHVIEEKQLQRPFATQSAFYVLIEFENSAAQELETAMSLFEFCLDKGWLVDGSISQNSAQAQSLWRLREDISATIAKFTPYKNDISIKVSRIPEFLQEVDSLVASAYPDFEIIWFGHIGDGNIHLNILKPGTMEEDTFFARCARVSALVFDIVEKHGGSISAEHGVGLLKKPFLHYSRSAAEIAYMKAIKNLFDPNTIMNPGKLLD